MSGVSKFEENVIPSILQIVAGLSLLITAYMFKVNAKIVPKVEVQPKIKIKPRAKLVPKVKVQQKTKAKVKIVQKVKVKAKAKIAPKPKTKLKAQPKTKIAQKVEVEKKQLAGIEFRDKIRLKFLSDWVSKVSFDVPNGRMLTKLHSDENTVIHRLSDNAPSNDKKLSIFKDLPFLSKHNFDVQYSIERLRRGENVVDIDGKLYNFVLSFTNDVNKGIYMLNCKPKNYKGYNRNVALTLTVGTYIVIAYNSTIKHRENSIVALDKNKGNWLYYTVMKKENIILNPNPECGYVLVYKLS